VIHYLDTSVLVAASVQTHPHYVPAFDLLKAVKDGAVKGCIGAHGLAEFYSVLTRTPFNPRIQPADAGRFLEDNILSCFEVIPLTASDYKNILLSCTHSGLIGGVVYDMLHLYAAEKSSCDRLYTFNAKDFRVLASPAMTGKIAAP
jgi:predicted nucleic acid-binding protein